MTRNPVRIVTTYRPPEKPQSDLCPICAWLGVPPPHAQAHVQAVAILLAGITLAVGLWVGFGLYVVVAS